jgi:hypothetical protein
LIYENLASRFGLYPFRLAYDRSEERAAKVFDGRDVCCAAMLSRSSLSPFHATSKESATPEALTLSLRFPCSLPTSTSTAKHQTDQFHLSLYGSPPIRKLSIVVHIESYWNLLSLG